MSHIQYIDGLIREYVLYRGFSNTLKSFDNELKNDKDKSFRVDKIVDQITYLINNQELQMLRELWSHLNTHLFCKLEHTHSAAVFKLEQSILKLYLVVAHTSNKDKVAEFFIKQAPELASSRNAAEWKDWFFFPFCRNPEENHVFGVCFTKQWQDTLMVSLHNFLATIFQCMHQPTLSRVEPETTFIRRLQDENSLLRSKLQMISQQQPPTSHQSRLTTFNDDTKQKSLNDVVAFDIPPPAHIVDDFYIIAQETINLGNSAESQARGLKSLIKNIGGSPIMGRKDNDRNKRSGSAGSKARMYN